MIARAVALLVLIYALGFALFAVTLPNAADDRKTDAIVVLTGGSGRMSRGLDLLERGRAERMLVSGVARLVKPNELAAQNDASRRLFACCIDLGKESVDTRSNAEETAKWMRTRGFRTMRLVTTDWHMARARFELSRRLPDDIEILSDGVQSNASFRTLFGEFNKYILRRAAVLLGY